MSKVKRTRTLKIGWLRSGEWYLLPTIHYDHVFDPLSITFSFLRFYIKYHSVLRYSLDEFKEMLKEKGFNTEKCEPVVLDF